MEFACAFILLKIALMTTDFKETFRKIQAKPLQVVGHDHNNNRLFQRSHIPPQ